ncbi:MAG: hypothetical protein EBY65_08175, partial [Acidimicrobiia bacterium]|nr:hypothetical protein [Acidimicrobiia bacterium]
MPMSTAFSPTAARSLGGPDWLVARRTAAAEAFAATERPDDAAEEWRYSLIGRFDLERYAPAHEFGDAPMPRLDVEPAALIRCVNGRVMFVEVDEGLVDQGVHIGPLAEDENGEARLGSVADDAGDYFTLLNDAFMDRPLLIDIPRGVVVDRPIVVTHHAAGAGGAA